jgi:putative SOS response-associated peptidase YedK
MCGRYRLTQAERFAEMSAVRLAWNPKPRYNIAPTQDVPVVLDKSPGELTELRWGLVPFWAKDLKIGSSLINARAETVQTKPAFREAYQRRRCLVPADGFYEWKVVEGGKIPHHITMADGAPFAFAGLWESWRDPLRPESEDPVRTFTIITGEPNELVASIHNRMPVIIPRDRYSDWLSPQTSAEERRELLAPFPAEKMAANPISPRVNNARNDDPAILDAAEPLKYRIKQKKIGNSVETAAEGTLWLFLS